MRGQITASGDLPCPPLLDSIHLAGMVVNIPGPIRIPRDIGQMSPLLPGILLGLLTALGPHGEVRLAGSVADLLPRHQCCKARLFLTKQSLPGRKCVRPTPLCRCDCELTAAPQACPTHLIIHSSTTLPPIPVLEDKRGIAFLGNSHLLRPAELCSLQHLQPLVSATLPPPGTSHHVAPVECVFSEWGQP